ncbi:acyl-CoA dehydrogenase [Acidocella sp.]|uniref:acyl-CoA dehydrogenase n=1 Tax=Acidocella sp. TaxID=50710 RepID=UPI003CFE70F2
MSYVPPIDDLRFLLTCVFDLRELTRLFAEEGFDAELALALLEEAGRFTAETLAPLNLPGDEAGCTLANGLVTTPPGFARAYRAYAENGWCALSAPVAHGGQGLPHSMQVLVDEMVSGANLSFGLFPGLTRGATEAISAHASKALKDAYLPKMISGEWTGVMALTEAAAGTDLGLLRAKAVPLEDGAHAITGTKIFISSGDHDFGGNIVHLVLARLPDAPAGVKGISLFLVPKFLPDTQGGLGARNSLSVGALEHKMGIHAQPTCVMNYDGAKGWLVGEPNRGLAAMFTMMNAERLFVGLQGLGIAHAAYLKAASYAKERRQGRAPGQDQAPAPIIEHPDVRRMLLSIRAFVEAGRALALWTAMRIDMARHHEDEATRAQADKLVSLLTPVVKAAFTDFGFEAAVQAQQVFGGHGYVHEWGMEQFVRDARIAQIYEGTNGVQALDLVSRKLPMDDGAVVREFFDLVAAELGQARAAGAGETAGAVEAALAELRRLTEELLRQAGDAAESGAASVEYLRMFALVCFGWMWARMDAAARRDTTSPPHESKPALARFFVSRMLPQTTGLAAAVRAGAASITALPAAVF